MTSHFPSDTDVALVRTFGAPRALVWKAWTDPDMLPRWWGPHGFTACECTIDLRPGGQYRIVAQALDGTRYPVSGVYLDIVEETRLVMTDNAEEMPAFWRAAYNRRRDAGAGAAPPEIILTLTLEDLDDGAGAKMTLSSRFATPADRAAALDMSFEETWRQSFEKMEATLVEGGLDKTGDDNA